MLFIKRTLCVDIFYDILCAQTSALNQYVFYLEQIGDDAQLVDLYM